MSNYTFEETLQFFADKLHAHPPEEDIKNGEVELVIDDMHVLISSGKQEGSLHMHTVLALILHSPSEEKLQELASSNFLGVNTGGCTLAFDSLKVSLSLHCRSSPGTSPQENWEWLHRLISIAREWIKIISTWEEFVPLVKESA